MPGPKPAPLPFHCRRRRTLAAPGDITAIREIVHGTLELDGDRLVVRWWIDRVTDRLGRDIRIDREPAPRHETALPLAALTRAELSRDPWWRMPRGARIEIGVRDPSAMVTLVGANGLLDAGPRSLVVRVRPADTVAARELVADLGLAIGDLALGREVDPGPTGPAHR